MVRKIFLWLVIIAIVVIAAFLAWQWYADGDKAAAGKAEDEARLAGSAACVIHEAARA